ncbi:hypothetical protein [Micromonospora siamensis]|uniref:Excreted virulence factor EspC, type VII ESX diderm n=1 Tax=Micromonospora siamensis TaxID=299152 RepID=A0A1C5ILS0_9ACTN|nr:hypothetical protein [Micromonospora siamensis]SCG59297.1 hypothetical protein GA0074704_3583 [Micromonospora siamensis]
MGDYSRAKVQVATEAIRAEAVKWRKLSDRMQTVARTTGDQNLSPLAFVVPDPLIGGVSATDLQSAYEKMHSQLTTLFTDAATEFDQFAGALNRNADWYEHAEEDNVANFDKIWSA